VRWGLRRIQETPLATIGLLDVEIAGKWRAVWTLELPWRMNARNVSRIPPGEYELEKLADRDRLRLTDVRGRTVSPLAEPGWERYAVDIHVANRVQELQGCIAVGYGIEWDVELGEPALQSSKAAMEDLLMVYAAAGTGARVILEIVDP
jgi:hypothetical protein